MIPQPPANTRIFIKPGATDMRKAINGLAGIVQNEFGLNPYESSIFAFSNRRADRIKILYWDRNGFCLWLKRLEQDRFPWPQNEKQVLEITSEELRWLLNGIDFRKAHTTLQFTKTG